MAKKFQSIDERDIKCCDNSDNTIKAGISFDLLENGTNVLRFHFLELINGKILTQTTKTMYLDRNNTSQLIQALNELNFVENSVCDCGNLAVEAFDPCCSLECWLKKFA